MLPIHCRAQTGPIAPHCTSKGKAGKWTVPCAEDGKFNRKLWAWRQSPSIPAPGRGRRFLQFRGQPHLLVSSRTANATFCASKINQLNHRKHSLEISVENRDIVVGRLSPGWETEERTLDHVDTHTCQ